MADPFGPGRGALPPRAWQRTSAPSLSLDGPWAFRLLGTPRAPADFAYPAFDDSGWGELPVPSHWQLHGHGAPSGHPSGSRKRRGCASGARTRTCARG